MKSQSKIKVNVLMQSQQCKQTMHITDKSHCSNSPSATLDEDGTWYRQILPSLFP